MERTELTPDRVSATLKQGHPLATVLSQRAVEIGLNRLLIFGKPPADQQSFIKENYANLIDAMGLLPFGFGSAEILAAWQSVDRHFPLADNGIDYHGRFLARGLSFIHILRRLGRGSLTQPASFYITQTTLREVLLEEKIDPGLFREQLDNVFGDVRSLGRFAHQNSHLAWGFDILSLMKRIHDDFANGLSLLTLRIDSVSLPTGV